MLHELLKALQGLARWAGQMLQPAGPAPDSASTATSPSSNDSNAAPDRVGPERVTPDDPTPEYSAAATLLGALAMSRGPLEKNPNGKWLAKFLRESLDWEWHGLPASQETPGWERARTALASVKRRISTGTPALTVATKAGAELSRAPLGRRCLIFAAASKIAGTNSMENDLTKLRACLGLDATQASRLRERTATDKGFEMLAYEIWLELDPLAEADVRKAACAKLFKLWNGRQQKDPDGAETYLRRIAEVSRWIDDERKLQPPPPDSTERTAEPLTTALRRSPPDPQTLDRIESVRSMPPADPASIAAYRTLMDSILRMHDLSPFERLLEQLPTRPPGSPNSSRVKLHVEVMLEAASLRRKLGELGAIAGYPDRVRGKFSEWQKLVASHKPPQPIDKARVALEQACLALDALERCNLVDVSESAVKLDNLLRRYRSACGFR